MDLCMSRSRLSISSRKLEYQVKQGCIVQQFLFLSDAKDSFIQLAIGTDFFSYTSYFASQPGSAILALAQPIMPVKLTTLFSVIDKMWFPRQVQYRDSLCTILTASLIHPYATWHTYENLQLRRNPVYGPHSVTSDCSYLHAPSMSVDDVEEGRELKLWAGNGHTIVASSRPPARRVRITDTTQTATSCFAHIPDELSREARTP